ncbi:MFS transporter [Niallia endozanthoxylica]|uniref:MFS transporter n=1 Tax=Niallia endozanthoxylica TaxID=2036016 RepID=A0A5J5I421_9BACI|nr:MFS transporter [Niallia endozanthoxylica]KAA9029908.1 MFS transporter [Niallia endozanthoxylica]
MKNKYLSTAFGLYLNYFVHGMGLIIISLNIDVFASKWGTSVAGAAAVVSSFGIGKLIAVFLSGVVSDKFGRKASIILGILFYLAFAIGILWSPTAPIAYFFGILAGIANSFLDTGTYPALMEVFPKKPGPANIIVKFFIQGGQFLLPIIIGFLVVQGFWYGWSFTLLIAILTLNLIFMSTRKFPPMAAPSPEIAVKEKGHEKKGKFHFSIEEICMISFGFVGLTLLTILGQWMAKYGTEVVQLGENAGRMLVSYASIGSLICVIVTFTLGNKGVKSSPIILTYTIMTALISLVLWAFPSPMVASVGAFFLGYFSAGGLIQLGLTLLVDHSNRGKGVLTSLYTISEGIAQFSMPLILAAISKFDIAYVFLLNAAVALLGFALVLIVWIRDKQRKVHQDIQINEPAI